MMKCKINRVSFSISSVLSAIAETPNLMAFFFDDTHSQALVNINTMLKGNKMFSKTRNVLARFIEIVKSFFSHNEISSVVVILIFSVRVQTESIYLPTYISIFLISLINFAFEKYGLMNFINVI